MGDVGSVARAGCAGHARLQARGQCGSVVTHNGGSVVRLSVYLSEADASRLRALAKARHLKVSALVKSLALQAVDKAAS